jgi:hypothetical protein
MYIRSCLFGLAVAALAASGAQSATNLLTNGSFETGDFTGWTLVADTSFTGVLHTGASFAGRIYNAEDGSYFASLGEPGDDGTLSQTFADVAGKTYESSFYFASDGNTPNDFGVTGPGGLSLPTETDVGVQSYFFLAGSFVGSGSDTITFNFRNDPGLLSLDNVQVFAVPEPATWAMMLVGIGGLGAVLRSRRKAMLANAL